MSRSRALIAAVAVLACAAPLAACDSGEEGASPSPSVSSSATASTPSTSTARPSQGPTPGRDQYARVELDATASGDLSGPLEVDPAPGCLVVQKPSPGSATSTTMAVKLPGGGQAALVIGAERGGATLRLAGNPNSGVVLLGSGEVRASSERGGSGTARVSKDGTTGTFDAVLASVESEPVRLKGSFRCS